ncbi:MAG TPA: HAMP domain-containing sensor histidine kinase, partial [Angustibacter sp.]|nr:HAMP domain-containing sensor histidine kinase [Angustibacter sp.]
FGAGVALLVAWRVGGWAAPGRVGNGLLAAAVLVSVVPRLSSAVGEPVSTVRPLVLAAILLAGGVVSARALDGSVVDTTVQPLHDLVRLIVLAVVGVLAGQLALDAGLLGHLTIARLVPATVAAAVAVRVLVGSRRATTTLVRPLVWFWLLLSVAFGLHAVPGALATAAAVACAGAAAALVAQLAAGFLKAALTAHTMRSLRTLAALAERSDAVQRERERRHDALNALAAIRSASDVLAASADDLDDETRRELATAARAELDRVERMLAASRDEGARELSLDDALRPVLLTWRQRGLAVEARLADAVVRADRDVVCRVVDNLLQNAFRHAPGARVRLQVVPAPGTVHLEVSNDGAALPAQRRSSAGQGVGLASSRRLAREVGGELTVLAASGRGYTVRLSLPAAVAANAADRQAG